MLAYLVAISLAAGLRVDWEAPVGCPDAAAVEAAVRDRLDAAFVTAPASVHGRLRGRPGAWTLDLEVHTTNVDARRMTDPDCATLTDAAALIVAVTIERTSTPPPPSEPVFRSIEPTTPTAIGWTQSGDPLERPATPRDMPEPEPEPEPAASPRSVRVGARAAAGVEVGALPGIGADVEIAGLLRRDRFVAELGARYLPPRRARYADAPDMGGDLSLWAITAAACFAPAAGRVRFPLCAGAEVGGMLGRGVGLPDTRNDHLPWSAARAGAGISIALLPFLRLSATAGLVVPFWRPAFRTDSRGPVHEAAPAAGRVHLGLEFIR